MEILVAVAAMSATLGWPHGPTLAEQINLNQAMTIKHYTRKINYVGCFPQSFKTAARWNCQVNYKTGLVKEYRVRVYEDGSWREKLVWTNRKKPGRM